jgi:hypothetical protein
MTISLNASWNKKYFRKSFRENENTFYTQQPFAVYEIMSRDVAEPQGRRHNMAHTRVMLHK